MVNFCHKCYSQGGNLDPSRIMTGEIADFNLWNYAMPDEEILRLGCDAQGNVINRSSLQIKGDLDMVYKQYQCISKCQSL